MVLIDAVLVFEIWASEQKKMFNPTFGEERGEGIGGMVVVVHAPSYASPHFRGGSFAEPPEGVVISFKNIEQT